MYFPTNPVPTVYSALVVLSVNFVPPVVLFVVLENHWYFFVPSPFVVGTAVSFCPWVFVPVILTLVVASIFSNVAV